MKGIQLQLMSCCDCSTIEGESELSTEQGMEQPSNIYLYTGAMMRDLTVEQHSTQNRLALSCHTVNTVSAPVIHQRRCTTCLTLPLPSK